MKRAHVLAERAEALSDHRFKQSNEPGVPWKKGRERCADTPPITRCKHGALPDFRVCLHMRTLTMTSPPSTVTVQGACRTQCGARHAQGGACVEGQTGQRGAHILSASMRWNTRAHTHACPLSAPARTRFFRPSTTADKFGTKAHG